VLKDLITVTKNLRLVAGVPGSGCRIQPYLDPPDRGSAIIFGVLNLMAMKCKMFTVQFKFL
jgi:hypothetical protein